MALKIVLLFYFYTELNLFLCAADGVFDTLQGWCMLCMNLTNVVLLCCLPVDEFMNSRPRPRVTIWISQFVGLALISHEESAARHLKCLSSECVVRSVAWMPACAQLRWLRGVVDCQEQSRLTSEILQIQNIITSRRNPRWLSAGKKMWKNSWPHTFLTFLLNNSRLLEGNTQTT